MNPWTNLLREAAATKGGKAAEKLKTADAASNSRSGVIATLSYFADALCLDFEHDSEGLTTSFGKRDLTVRHGEGATLKMKWTGKKKDVILHLGDARIVDGRDERQLPPGDEGLALILAGALDIPLPDFSPPVKAGSVAKRLDAAKGEAAAGDKKKAVGAPGSSLQELKNFW